MAKNLAIRVPERRPKEQVLPSLGDLDPKAAGARRFAGKVCVITGAGQGIGRATAKRLGAEGGKIVCTVEPRWIEVELLP